MFVWEHSIRCTYVAKSDDQVDRLLDRLEYASIRHSLTQNG